MCKTIGSLKVFFEDPFWVGLFEIYYDNRLTVSKVTFGAEPKDSEIYNFVLTEYFRLNFSPAVEACVKDKRINPKRMQRELHKTPTEYIGTKSQQALKLQHEQFKNRSSIAARERKKESRQRRFELKQQKRKEKHKGK